MRFVKPIVVAMSLSLLGAGGGFAVAGPAYAVQKPHSAGGHTVRGEPAVVKAETAVVNGKSEKILVDSRGLPLYTYGLDTARKSHVDPGLARLWPPLLANSLAIKGTNGKLTVVVDGLGHQVRYNGHFLYTFVDDSPGHVNGQGVQDFFVAVPATGSSGVAAGAASTGAGHSSGSWQ